MFAKPDDKLTARTRIQAFFLPSSVSVKLSKMKILSSNGQPTPTIKIKAMKTSYRAEAQ